MANTPKVLEHIVIARPKELDPPGPTVKAASQAKGKGLRSHVREEHKEAHQRFLESKKK
jgi:hypothetical protein